MPTLNLGRVGFVNKGDYIGGTTEYKVNDLVQYGSGTYACIQPHSTEFLPTNILYWQKWTDFGIHQVVNIGSTVRSSADSIYLNAFSGAQTGIISLKITELIAATATAVDMSYMEITITQDDRDNILGTNPHSYKFMIKGNMDVGVWYNVQAVSLGTTDFAPIDVRFTRTATDAYIEIGNVGTAWQYPTIEVSHVTDNIITGYTKVFIATLQNSLIGTTTDSLISVIPYNIAPTIHAATAKATPIDADEFGIWDSVSGVLRKVTFANMKSIFAVLDSPAFTGTPTAPTAGAGTNTTQIATTAFVKAKSELDSIGVGQAWQDVTGSRVLGTVYTNSTGKPIQVHVTGYTSAGTIGFQINSVTYQSYTYTANGYICFSVIVPPGATYGLTNPGGVSIHSWSELR